MTISGPILVSSLMISKCGSFCVTAFKIILPPFLWDKITTLWTALTDEWLCQREPKSDLHKVLVPGAWNHCTDESLSVCWLLTWMNGPLMTSNRPVIRYYSAILWMVWRNTQRYNIMILSWKGFFLAPDVQDPPGYSMSALIKRIHVTRWTQHNLSFHPSLCFLLSSSEVILVSVAFLFSLNLTDQCS